MKSSRLQHLWIYFHEDEQLDFHSPQKSFSKIIQSYFGELGNCVTKPMCIKFDRLFCFHVLCCTWSFFSSLSRKGRKFSNMALGTFLALQFGKERKQKSFFQIFKIIPSKFQKKMVMYTISNREEIFLARKNRFSRQRNRSQSNDIDK